MDKQQLELEGLKMRQNNLLKLIDRFFWLFLTLLIGLSSWGLQKFTGQRAVTFIVVSTLMIAIATKSMISVHKENDKNIGEQITFIKKIK